MATTQDPTFEAFDLADDFAPFWRDYYKEDLLWFLEEFPQERRRFTIQWRDLFQFHQASAETFLEHPEPVKQYLIDDLADVSVPVPVNWAKLKLGVELPTDKHLKLGDLRSDHGEQYIAIRGRLQKLSEPQEQLDVLSFQCAECGVENTIPQPRTDVQEPHACKGCERQGPFTANLDNSETTDRVEAIVKEPPHESTQSAREVHCYLEDDLLELGGDGGIFDHAGERVVFHGVYEGRVDLDSRNADPLVERFMDVQAVTFPESNIHADDIREHKDEFTELAERDDAHQLVQESIAPTISGSDRVEKLKMAAWMFLFAAPEWKDDDGNRFRGDIHQLWIGDPGTGKTTIGDDVVDLSPKCEDVSATNSSGVGLTASAEQDDFAGGEWSLQPGALPLASGGHVRVDELDKLANSDQDKLHEALEKQRINVRKASLKAQLETKAGMLATGNPSGGRWDDYSNELEQIDMDSALLSRFDLVLKVRDRPDEERDRHKATHLLDAMHEIQADTDEKVATNRPVSKDVLRAWVAYARENITPTLTEAAKAELKDFFVDERNDQSTDDDRVPITMRKLEAGVRLAAASARLALREEILTEDVERAIDITKRMMGDVYLDETGHPDAGNIDETQGALADRVKRHVGNNEPVEIDAVIENVRGAESKIKHQIEKCKQSGEFYQPETGVLRTT